jgi:predicted ArsR family transcriptional regulator
MSRIAEAAMGDRPYHDLPGYKELTTSKAAAESVAGGSAAARARVFRIIARSPATADEVAAALGLSVLYVRPRVSELREAGQIVPSGDRRPNDSGRMAAVWRIKV